MTADYHFYIDFNPFLGGSPPDHDPQGVSLQGAFRDIFVNPDSIYLHARARALTPPGSPQNGDAYLIAGTGLPTGAWSGHKNDIAIWEAANSGANAHWEFVGPKTNNALFVQDPDGRHFYRYNVDTWQVVSDPSPPGFLDVGYSDGRIVGDIDHDGVWDGDGIVNSGDATAAANLILREVRKLFKPFGSTVTVDLAHFGDGVFDLSLGIGDEDDNVFVAFVGSKHSSNPLLNGISKQALEGANFESDVYTYAGNIARGMLTGRWIENGRTRGQDDPYDFVTNVAQTIAHEFGHALGLGHPQYQDKHGNWQRAYQTAGTDKYFSIMASGSRRLSSSFVNKSYPNVKLKERVFGVFNEFRGPQNQFAELTDSFSGNQPTDSNGFDVMDFSHDEVDINPAFVFDPPAVTPPAASQGVLGSTTISDVAGMLQSGFNTLRDEFVDDVAQFLNLGSNSLPLIDSTLSDLLGIVSSLQAQIAPMNVGSITSLGELQAALEASGFQVQHILTDSELSALPTDQPADIVRARYTTTLANLAASTSLSPASIAALTGLGSASFSGNLNVLAQVGLNIDFGVDTGGFYLLPGRVMEAPIDIEGLATATVGSLGSVGGQVALGLVTSLDLNSSQPDGRLRLPELSTGLAGLTSFDYQGRGGVHLGFELPTGPLGNLRMDGIWAWDVDPSGFTLDPYSPGLDANSLHDSLATWIGNGSAQLASQANALAGMSQGLPLLGSSFGTDVANLFASSLSFADDDLIDPFASLRDKGFDLQVQVTPEEFLDSVLHGTPLPQTLLSATLSHGSSTGPGLASASGSLALDGLVDAQVSLAGQMTATADLTTSMTFGLDTVGGVFLLEGGHIGSSLTALGNLSGTANIGGLVGLTMSATANVVGSATATIDDGDPIGNERLYLLGTQATSLANAIDVDLSGSVDLESIVVTVPNPLQHIPGGLGGLFRDLTLTGSATLDLATGSTSITFGQNDVSNWMARQVAHGIQQLRTNAEVLTQSLGAVPLIGDSLRQAMGGLVVDTLDIDPDLATNDFAAYLSGRGFELVGSTVTFEDILDGSYTTGDLIQVRLNRNVQPSSQMSLNTDGGVEFQAAGVDLGFHLTGDLTLLPSLDVDMTFGIDMTGGAYVVAGASLAGNLTVDGHVEGRAAIGNLPGVKVDGDASLDINTSAVLDGAHAGDRLYLASLDFVHALGNPDWYHADGSAHLDAALILDNPARQIPVLRDILPDNFQWDAGVSFSFDLGDFASDGQLALTDTTYTIDMENLELAGLGQQIWDRFLENLDEYNPLPKDFRTFLGEPLVFLGNQSFLDILGLGNARLFIDPGAYVSEDPESAAGDGVTVHLDFTDPDNVFRLLTGQTADLISIDIQTTFSEEESLPLMPPELLATYFGVVNLVMQGSLLARLGLGIDVSAGFDTKGFYFEEGPSLVSIGQQLGDGVGVSIQLDLDLGIVPVASVTLDGTVSPFVAIGIDAPGESSKVRIDDLFRHGHFVSDVIGANLGVNLNLHSSGYVGFRDLESLNLYQPLPHYDIQRELYRTDVGGGDIGTEAFADIVQSLQGKAEKIKQAALALASGNPVLVIAAAANLFSEEIGAAAGRAVAWADNQSQAIVAGVQDLSNQIGDALRGVADSVSELGERIDRELFQPVLAATGIGDLVSLVNGRVHLDDVAPLQSFTHEQVGSELIITWNPNHGYAGVSTWADLGLTYLADKDEIIIDGEDFDKHQKIGTREWVDLGGHHEEDVYDNVHHANQVRQSLDGISTIRVIGTNLNDVIIVNSSVPIGVLLDGYGGDDLLVGGGDNDTLNGGNGADTLIGNSGDDEIYGGNDSDVLVGDYGDDMLDGGGGDDFLDEATHADFEGSGDGFYLVPPSSGGERNSLYGGAGDDTMLGSEGRDTLEGEGNDDYVMGNGGRDYLTGGGGNDFLDGGGDNDQMEGGGNNDYLIGGKGNDQINGDSGNDTIYGDDKELRYSGIDVITGGSGFDVIYAGRGADTVDGGPDADLIFGNDGDDDLVGGDDVNDGNDFIDGGAGNDHLIGGMSGSGRPILPTQDNSAKSYDILVGGDGVDILEGGAGPDLLEGGQGNDLLRGQAGEDTLQGMFGRDQLYGDAGNDLIYASSDGIYGSTVQGGDGSDTLVGSEGDDNLQGGGDNDSLAGSTGDDRLDGGDGADVLYGDEGSDTLVGGLGTDVLYAASSAAGQIATADVNWLYGDTIDWYSTVGNRDILYGDVGGDQLYAGAGNDDVYALGGDDEVYGSWGSDKLVGGTGTDQIYAGLSAVGGGFTFDVNTLYGDTESSSDTAGVADFLYGDVGADSILGGAGNDCIVGGLGNDWLVGGLDLDTIYAGLSSAGGGSASNINTLYGDNESAVDTAGAADLLFGDMGTDSIMGGAGNDCIVGGLGSDWLVGGLGLDTVYAGADAGGGGSASDVNTLYGDAESASDLSGSQDTLYGDVGRDLIYAGAGNDDVFALAGDDRVEGDGGDDLLVGGTGNDELFGESESDLLWGGAEAYTRAYLVAQGFANLVGQTSIGGNDGDGDDSLIGGTGMDWLFGGGGSDQLSGDAEGDYLDAGRGNDLLVSGGTGADYVRGGIGQDILFGNDGDDSLRGDDDSDILFGGVGNDSLFGGYGTDTLYGGADSLGGGSATDVNYLYGDTTLLDDPDGLADTLWGDVGDDFIYAGLGADRVFGLAGMDWIEAGAGDDTVFAGVGSDVVVGGLGSDFIYAGLSATGGGSSADVNTLYGDSMASDDPVGSPDFLFGDIGNDSLYGGAGHELLDGLAGSDFLVGGFGQDSLVGGADNDSLYGGQDSDRLEGQDGNDFLYGGNGIDVLVLDIDPAYTTGDSESLDGHGPNAPGLVAPADDNATDILLVKGSQLDDVITIGEASPGVLRVDYNLRPAPIFLSWRNGPTPLIEQFWISGVMGDDVLSFDPNFDVSILANRTVGGVKDWVAVLDGGPGNDTLRGTTAQDFLDGGADSDAIYALAGDDRLWGDQIAGQVQTDITDSLFGGAGNDDLIGGTGNNLLFAWSDLPSAGGAFAPPAIDLANGTGNDRLLGNIGNDSLYAGTGFDFLYDLGGGIARFDRGGHQFDGEDPAGYSDAWKAYIRENDAIWYVAADDLANEIQVNRVDDNAPFLPGFHIVTIKTGPNSFVPLIRINGLDGRDGQGNEGSSLLSAADRLDLLDPDTLLSRSTRLDGPGQNYLPQEGDYDAIFIDALGGADIVTVGGTVRKTVWVDAGDGDDKVTIEPITVPTDYRNVILGGDGADTLAGGSATDWIFAGSSDDWLYGGPDAGRPDLVFGQDDNDTFQLIPESLSFGLTTADRFDGGSDEDRVLYLSREDVGIALRDYLAFRFNSTLPQPRYELTSLEWDTANNRYLTDALGNYVERAAFYQAVAVERTAIFTGAGDDVVRLDAENGLVINTRSWGIAVGDGQRGASAGGFEVYGGDGNDTLVGGSFDDTLVGQAGNDFLFGGSGGDRLEGRSDNDVLVGDGKLSFARAFLQPNGFGTGLFFSANISGTGGNAYSVQFLGGTGNRPLQVGVVNNQISVYLGLTNGVVTSTAQQIVDAVANYPLAAALVNVQVMGNGTDIIQPMALALLSGGMDLAALALPPGGPATGQTPAFIPQTFAPNLAAFGLPDFHGTLQATASTDDTVTTDDVIVDVLFSGFAGTVNDAISSAASIGDYNGDGYEDLLLWGSTRAYVVFGPIQPDDIQAAANSADLVFDLSAFGQPLGQWADVNADGLADLVFRRTSGSSEFRVVFGNRTPTTRAPAASLTRTIAGAHSAAVLDFNGDGYSDIVVTTTSPQVQQRFYSGAVLTHETWTNSQLVIDSVSTALEVRPAGDVNGDGRQDLGLGTQRMASIYVLPGMELPYSATPTTITLDSAIPTLTTSQYGGLLYPTGDVSGDGYADFALTRPFGGSDLRASDYTTGNVQHGTVAVAPDGSFIGVWEPSIGGSINSDVFARTFGVDGSPLGPEFRVNSHTAGDQTYPSIAMDSEGNSVIVWQSMNQDGSDYGIYAQRFSASGALIGGEFRVNDYTTGDQKNAKVAVDSDGDFVVVWESSDTSGFGIYFRRFAEDGSPIGLENLVNTYTANDQRSPAVAIDDAGNFVVAWASSNQDGSGSGIYGQRIDSTGHFVGTEFRVNQVTLESQFEPSVAIDDDGNFVVSWCDAALDGDVTGVAARILQWDNVDIGAVFLVNDYAIGEQGSSSVSFRSDGTILVGWMGQGSGVSSSAFARTFTAAGVPLGPSWRLHQSETLGEFIDGLTVASTPAGGLVVFTNGNSSFVWYPTIRVFSPYFDPASPDLGFPVLGFGSSGLNLLPDLDLKSFFPASIDVGAGFSLTAGDFNGDGKVDLAFGQTTADGNQGEVIVLWSPLEGTGHKTTIKGAVANDRFGKLTSLRAADLDGDRIDDLVVVAAGANGGAGVAYVLSGAQLAMGLDGTLPTSGVTTLANSDNGANLVGGGPPLVYGDDPNEIAKATLTGTDAKWFRFTTLGDGGAGDAIRFDSLGGATAPFELSGIDGRFTPNGNSYAISTSGSAFSVGGAQGTKVVCELDLSALMAYQGDLSLIESAILNVGYSSASALPNQKLLIYSLDAEGDGLLTAEDGYLIGPPMRGTGALAAEVSFVAGSGTISADLTNVVRAAVVRGWTRLTLRLETSASASLDVERLGAGTALVVTTASVRADLFDAQGALVYAAREAIILNGLAAGTYYLKVYGPGRTSASPARAFTLSITAPLAGQAHATSNRDVIVGGDGLDELIGNSGSDHLFGDKGDGQSTGLDVFIGETVELVEWFSEPVFAPPTSELIGNTLVSRPDPLIRIPDLGLKGAIAEAIGLPVTMSWAGYPYFAGNLRASDLASLQHLNAADRRITQLEGLQYATNLLSLNLANNQVSSLAWTDQSGAAARLPASLQALVLDSNLIADLSVISSFFDLEALSLDYNPIAGGNISALSGLSSLRSLSIDAATSWVDTDLSNVTALAGLSNLESLSLVGNQITSAVSLAGLTNLQRLYLDNNRIGSTQRLDPASVSQGNEFRINTYTTASQTDVVVSMSATGDFVAVWQSNGQDGSGYGIYGQRYNAAGVAQGNEFLVNTSITSWQKGAAAAMDSAGNFVVVWSSYNQDGSSAGVYGQRYNTAGTAQGSEFRVNTYTTSSQDEPSVAMDSDGDFVVVWSSSGQDDFGHGIYAQRYNSAGVAQGLEFSVNTYTTGTQSDPSIAMDADGDFVIVWSSYGQDGGGYGVYAQRYNAAGVAQGDEFRVNTYTTLWQNDAHVAMDSSGAFVVTWLSENQDSSALGVYAQRYSAAGVAQGSEFRVSSLATSWQGSPSVTMDSDGEFVIAWSSDQDGSDGGIFARRYNSQGIAQSGEYRVNTFTTGRQEKPSIAMDAFGDLVVAWTSGNDQDGSGYGIYAQIYRGAMVTLQNDIRVNTYTTAAQFTDIGNKKVATDSAGNFVVVWQSYGQDGSGYGVYAQRYDAAGVAQGSEFQVNSTTMNQQLRAAVAMDADGDFVVTWVSFDQDGGGKGVYARRYSALGVPLGGEFLVNSYTTGDQLFPTVAMHSGGDFIVAWTSYGQDGDGYGVYAQRYSAVGAAQGGEFLVNSHTTSYQSRPTIAIDADGEFVVAWQSFEQDGSSYGIYAQRYNGAGVAQGGEFLVNSNTTSFQYYPSIAIDAGGSFIIAWASNGQDGDGTGIFAQRYSAVGVVRGDEFRVNSFTTGRQEYPSVSMDGDGDFVLTWESASHDGDGYGVYAQRYTAIGDVQGSEFQVNSTTLNDQRKSSIAMDSDGDFIVAWSSLDQDGSGYGVYVQRYASAIPQVIQVNSMPELMELSLRDNPLGNGTHQTVLPELLATPGLAVRFDLNQAPVISNSDSAVQMLAETSIVVNLDANDPDGDHVYFTASSNNPNIAVSVAGNRLTILPNGTYFTGAFVTVTAFDGPSGPGDWRGRTATWTFEVQVETEAELTPVLYGSTSASSPALAALSDDFKLTYRWSGSTAPGGPLTKGVSLYPAITPTLASSTVTTYTYASPAVATAGDGRSVAAYIWSIGPNLHLLYVQRFAANGQPDGSLITVATAFSPAGAFHNVRLAMDTSGDFVVVWDAGGDTYAQQYFADGARLNDTFKVHLYTTGNQVSPSVAMDAAGNFVVVWVDDREGIPDVYAQRFNSTGQRRGLEFRVNTTNTDWPHLSPVVRMDQLGNFVVAWAVSGDEQGIYWRRFTAGGTPLDELRIATANSSKVDLAVDPLGDFIVTWDKIADDGSRDIVGRAFSRDGAMLGTAEFQVNIATPGDQSNPTIAMRADGDFAIAWENNSDSSVRMRRFEGNLSPFALSGGPYTVIEGQYLTLDASSSSDPNPEDALSYTWDVNGDGVYGDVVGVRPTLTWAYLVGLGLGDGPATISNLRVRVTDGTMTPSGPHYVTSAPTTLTVTNASPSASAGGPYSIVEGGTLVLAGSSSDPSPGDSVSFSWDIDGDGAFDDASGQNVTLTWSQLAALGIVDGSASVPVRVRTVDGEGGVTDSDPVTVTIANVAPTIPLSGAANALEGLGYSLTLGNAVDPGQDTVTQWIVHWDADHTETFNSAGVKTHVYGDGPGAVTIVVDLVDEDGLHIGAGSQAVTIQNVAPVAGLTIPSLGLRPAGQNGNAVRGQNRLYTLTAADWSGMDQSALFSFAIDWDGNGSTDQTVVGPSGTQVEHVFTSSGTFNVRVTATDKDGSTSFMVQQSVKVVDWDKQIDPNDPSKTNLIWGGTNGFDAYYFIPPGLVLIQAQNNAYFSSPQPVITGGFNGKVYVYAQGAGDLIFADVMSASMVIDGGDGDDVLIGGRGADSIFGGNGNDIIFGGTLESDANDWLDGGAGNDLLVGHFDADTLKGGTGQDFLIAGRLVFNDLPGAVFGIQSEWTSGRPLAERVVNLTGSGSGAGDNNGNFLVPNSTVFDDSPSSPTVIDQVFGEGEGDWLLYDFSDDLVPDIGPEDVTLNLG